MADDVAALNQLVRALCRGIDKETLRRFYAELLRKNRERQTPFPAIDVWTKFMESITFPRLVKDEATKQLQNPT